MNARASILQVAVALAAIACGSGEGGATSASASSRPAAPASAARSAAPSASVAPSASAAAAPADLPGVAAVKKGVWRDHRNQQESKLVDLDLSGCFGFKGYTIKAPEGAKAKALPGARSCEITFPAVASDKSPTAILIVSDELAPNHVKKADQKGVTNRPYEAPDAYVFEVQEGKEKGLLGEWEGKVGPHTLYCSPTYYGEYDLEAYQSIFELCRSLKFEEKK